MELKHGQGTDNRSLQIVVPYPSSPVADCQEILREHRVALQRVDGPVVPGIDRSDAIRRGLGLALAQQHSALLSPNQEVRGTRSDIVAQRHASQGRRVGTHLQRHAFERFAQLTDIPATQRHAGEQKCPHRARLATRAGTKNSNAQMDRFRAAFTHQKKSWPSVETVAHSVPVLLCSHATS